MPTPVNPSLGGHYSISMGERAGVFVKDKLFISNQLDGALKILNFIICLFRTGLKIYNLFHAEHAEFLNLKNIPATPPPLKIKWFSHQCDPNIKHVIGASRSMSTILALGI